MLTIAAGRVPELFLRIQQDPAANFDTLDKATKQAVREALWDEQCGKCAYCERRLNSGDSAVKIEHFHPRSAEFSGSRCESETEAKNREKSVLAWQNLLLVCSGRASSGRQPTCDTAKADAHICEEVHNPKRKDLPPTQVACDYTGWISLIGSGSSHVIDDVLNLNDEQLCSARKNLWSELMEAVGKALSGGSSRAKLGRKLREEAKTKDYGSVYLTLAERLASAH